MVYVHRLCIFALQIDIIICQIKIKKKKHEKISKKLSFNKKVLICILIHSSLINRTILTAPTP